MAVPPLLINPAAFAQSLTEGLAGLVNQANLDKLTKILLDGESGLPGESEIVEFSDGTFGRLGKGRQLCGDANLARDYLVMALVEMAENLGLYVEGVKVVRQGFQDADADSASGMFQLQTIVESAEQNNNDQDRDA